MWNSCRTLVAMVIVVGTLMSLSQTSSARGIKCRTLKCAPNCVPDTGPDDCPRCACDGPTCEDALCDPGSVCELKQVQCFTTPCYPRPTCVPAPVTTTETITETTTYRTTTPCPGTNDCTGNCFLDYSSGECPNCICGDTYCMLFSPCPSDAQCIDTVGDPPYYCFPETNTETTTETTPSPTPPDLTPTPCPTIDDCTGYCFLDYSSGGCPNCICGDPYCMLYSPCPPDAQCIDTDSGSSYYCSPSETNTETTPTPPELTTTPCPAINDCTGNCFLDYSSGECPNCICGDTYCMLFSPCSADAQCIDSEGDPPYYCLPNA